MSNSFINQIILGANGFQADVTSSKELKVSETNSLDIKNAVDQLDFFIDGVNYLLVKDKNSDGSVLLLQSINAAVEAIKVQTDKLTFDVNDLQVKDSSSVGSTPIDLDIINIDISTTLTNEIISGVGGKVIKIYGISFHNNDTDNDESIALFGGVILYGGTGNGIRLTANGGFWGIAPSEIPLWTIPDGVDFFIIKIDTTVDVGGVVWYKQE